MSISFRQQNNIGFIEFDHPQAKVNILSAEVLQQFDAIVEEIKRKSEIKAVFILSKKKDIFIAGADIKEIEGINEKEEGVLKAQAGQNIFNQLEDLNILTIAVIDGVALGGGCELALACRYRIATFNEKVRIGLPEVNLGIIPGFGGTYRMPRLLGLEKGLRMIATGKVISGPEALKAGLVDRLYPAQGLEEHLLNFLEEVSPKPVTRRKPKKFKQKFLEDNPIGRLVLFKEFRRSVLESTKGFYPAPLKAVEVVEASVGKSREFALELERKGFSELVTTKVSKNLVKVFYLSEKYKKLTWPGTENLTAKPLNRAAVLGAGVMGGGIAQLLSFQGMSVRLKDINYEAIGKGLKAARKIFDQAVHKRKTSASFSRIRMAQISPALDYSGFPEADVVIEAVVENMDIKKKVFAELGKVTSPQALLCTNTSALSVTQMAQATQNPSRVIGLHFFNPVHRMPLIEIVKTDLTSLETLAAALQLVKRLGKTPIVVKDGCGFLVNRVLLGYINEAGRLLEEGAGLTQIDKLVTDFGLPMGPFLLTDEVGIDVGIKVLHILADGLGERFKPVETFEKIYKAGFLGKKSGKGFYVHGKSRSLNPKVMSMVTVHHRRAWNSQEAIDRMILLMVNEAALCLQEKIVEDPGAVDIGMIMGMGFPPFRGGLLRYADSLGIEMVIDRLRAFEKNFGPRFQPCPFLLKMQERQEKFFS